MAAQHDPASAAPMELGHRTSPAGETVVDLGGDLDILSAELAVSYVRDVIDRHHGPVQVNLTALAFCDARGLSALVRMARYAKQKDCPFRMAAPSPSLIRIMRITGLTPNERFATKTTAGPFYLEVDVILEPSAGGTQITSTWRGDGRGFFKVAEPLVVRLTRKQSESAYDNVRLLRQHERLDA